MSQDTGTAGPYDLMLPAALLQCYRVRPEHPALYQQLHHHPASDDCHSRLERLAKDGEEGKKKMRITRYTTVAMA